jgi:hypothetical protein
MKYFRIDMGVDKKITLKQGQVYHYPTASPHSGDDHLRQEDFQPLALQRQLDSAFGPAVGLDDIPGYGIIPDSHL